jgi:hypothetical protein
LGESAEASADVVRNGQPRDVLGGVWLGGSGSYRPAEAGGSNGWIIARAVNPEVLRVWFFCEEPSP